MNMNSKFLKNLLKCLREKRHSHMLRQRNILEFEITYKHMKNPTWTPKDISLFEEMDFLYNPQRQMDIHFYEQSKGRFKANMRKLCDTGALKEEEICDESNSDVNKSIKKKRYRFLKMHKEPFFPAHETNAMEEYMFVCKDIEQEMSHSHSKVENLDKLNLQVNKKKKIETFSVFERGKRIPDVAEDSMIHSSVNKEMEIIMSVEKKTETFSVFERRKRTPDVTEDSMSQSSVNKEMKIIMSAELVTNPLEEPEESSDLKKLMKELECDEDPQVNVVEYVLGNNEDGTNLVPLMKAYEHDKELQMLKELETNCNDPFLTSACDAEAPPHDTISADSESEFVGICDSTFSFSQNEEDLLSLY